MPRAQDDSGQAHDDASTSGTGVWQILWNKGGVPQRLAFEASQGTRENLHRHTERWLGQVNEGAGAAVQGRPSEDE